MVYDVFNCVDCNFHIFLEKMFSIVSMQEVLINLNGGDELFKLFEGPRSKKRSVTKCKFYDLYFTYLSLLHMIYFLAILKSLLPDYLSLKHLFLKL